MKILLIQPYGDRIGHHGLFAAHLAQELSELDHQVVLITGTRLDAERILGTRRAFRLIEMGLREPYSSDISKLPNVFKKVMHGPAVVRINFAVFSQAIELSALERVDVMHVMDTEAVSTAGLLGWNALVKKNRLPPLVIQVFPVDFSFSAHPDSPLRGAYKVVARWALHFLISRFCSAVIVQGEWHRPIIMEQLGFREATSPPFVVVRPGTNLPRRTTAWSEARRVLQLDPEATVFLFFGMLRKDKGLDLLLEACSGLAGEWQLLIAGTGYDWSARALDDRIAQLGLGGRVRADVRYIPEEELETYFAAAEVAVLPYRGERYPGNYGPMILAAGYGKPLIVSDVGEMGRLTREYRLGYAVRPDDVAALRDALEAFLRLPAATRAEMGSHALRLAEECSFASMARNLSGVYGRIHEKSLHSDGMA